MIFLDKLVRPEVRLFGRTRSTYLVCGYVGVALGVFWAMALGSYVSLSLWVMVGMMLTAVLTFFGVVFGIRLIYGEESLTYYHHEIAILGTTTLFLVALHQPILPYLDIIILGLGVFLVWGRLGCLMVGCCHGRPCRWGVCYHENHAAVGFPFYYVGIRLFPIQAIESLWVFCVVLIGSSMVLGNQLPGEALTWYVVAYGLGRFCFEFIRGDTGRPDLWGFSEAQWTSLLLITAVVGAEVSGIFAFHLWHVAAMGSLILAMIVVTLSRRFQKTPKHQLLHPDHIQEIATLLKPISNSVDNGEDIVRRDQTPETIQVKCSSLGIQISSGEFDDGAGQNDHYAFSSRHGKMTQESATTVAELILQLKHSTAQYKLVSGNQGVFHLFIYPVMDMKQS